MQWQKVFEENLICFLKTNFLRKLEAYVAENNKSVSCKELRANCIVLGGTWKRCRFRRDAHLSDVNKMLCWLVKLRCLTYDQHAWAGDCIMNYTMRVALPTWDFRDFCCHWVSFMARGHHWLCARTGLGDLGTTENQVGELLSFCVWKQPTKGLAWWLSLLILCLHTLAFYMGAGSCPAFPIQLPVYGIGKQ